MFPFSFSHACHASTAPFCVFDINNEFDTRLLISASLTGPFRLRDCKAITDLSLHYLGTCQELAALYLANNPNLTTLGIRSLFKTHSSLSTLEIINCPKIEKEAVYYMTANPFQVLRLINMPSLTDEPLRAIADATSIRQHIHELDLSQAVQIGDFGLVSVAMKCRFLTTLNLNGCRAISETSMDVVFKLAGLRHLELRDCIMISDRCFSFEEPCMLQHLDLTGCVEVSDIGIENISSFCPDLTFISLERLPKVTDACIRTLLFGCHFMSNINIANCQGLTPTAVQNMIDSTMYLRFVNLFAIPNLTARMVADLVHANDGLRQIVIMSSPELTRKFADALEKQEMGRLVCYCDAEQPPQNAKPELLSSTINLKDNPSLRRSINRTTSRGSVVMSANPLRRAATLVRMATKLSVISVKGGISE
jgi:hypothetical protein